MAGGFETVELNVKESQLKRRQFYRDVFGTRTDTSPSEVFAKLCEHWREVTNATWVWLWVFNEYSNKLELYARCNGDFGEMPCLFSIDNTTLGAVQYSIDSGKPVYVKDFSNWQMQVDSKAYTVSEECKTLLNELQCASYDVIPVISGPVVTTPGPADSESFVLRAALSLHYKNESDRVGQNETSSRLMGDLTASKMIDAFQSYRFKILVELNNLASKYLTQVSKRPEKDRYRYLEAFADLIRKRLFVAGVSVFYKAPFESKIECLFTTGLVDNNKNPISELDLSNVVYAANEGLTGRCFANGEVLYIPNEIEFGINHRAKFSEIGQEGLNSKGPCLLIPIPISSRGERGEESTQSDGVIRVAEHRSTIKQSISKTFDPLETETLIFIAQQISSVLDMLSVRVQREHQVSIIKHDLDSPLIMITDTVDQIESEVEAQKRISEYCIPDLKMSAMVARNLVAQLDAEPTSFACQFKRIYLEGDVIARNAAMLKHYANKKKRMRIRFDGFREIPALYVDPDLIERVFFNLISNAIKYGEENTEIFVNARKTPAGYCVDVSNYGVGVDPQERTKIFKKYFRGKKAERESMGVGLGLYIAKMIMEKHGGRISLLGLKNPTVFSLFFPNELARERK